MTNPVRLANCPPRKRLRRNNASFQCLTCTSIFYRSNLVKLNSKAGLPHKTRDEYLASIRNNCDFCKLIFSLAVQQFGNAWLDHENIVFRNFSTLQGRVAPIYVLRGTLKNKDGYITLCPFVEQDDPLSTSMPRRPLVRDVYSPAVMSAAKRLLHECLGTGQTGKGHQECRHSRDAALPTRVLRVGVHGGTVCPIQLITSTRDHCESYVALSYCWGPKPDCTKSGNLFQLVRDNQKQLEGGIKMENLEQTIQDAVSVTRQLGFDYLWVDRFCIIQDDAADRDWEFSRMATTYKNAVVTLAAATAEAASQGFLNPCPPQQKPFLPERKFRIPMEDGRKGTVYLADKPYQPMHPLDTRGWTLQEFMLSSRMLMFSDFQLLWQCKQVELQSVTGNDAGLEYQQHLESLPWTAFDDIGGASFGAHDSEKLYLWKTILRQYSERRLSVAEDRLPAITGIITELQSVWKDTAIYGHWEEWFVQLLAWYKPQDDRATERHLTRAPSWSWVSVDGKVRFEDPIEKEDAKMEIVTAGKVTMLCRMVRHDAIDQDELETMCQYLDLTEQAAIKDISGRTYHYLFLGRTRECDGLENAIALMVVETSKGVYRRVGLAVFADMSPWTAKGYQVVELEPKQQ